MNLLALLTAMAVPVQSERVTADNAVMPADWMQVVIAAAVAAALPAVDAAWSFPGVMVVMMTASACCAVLALGLPAQGLRGSGGDGSGSLALSQSIPVFLALTVREQNVESGS